MYLVQFEDGVLMTIESISDSLKQECNDGYLAIIDISDPKNPKEYFQDGWTELQEYDRIDD